jgi:hypothetical protein
MRGTKHINKISDLSKKENIENKTKIVDKRDSTLGLKITLRVEFKATDPRAHGTAGRP